MQSLLKKAILLCADPPITGQHTRVSDSILLFCRLFNSSGEEIKRTEFSPGGNYHHPEQEGSFDLYGDRVIKLGTNM